MTESTLPPGVPRGQNSAPCLLCEHLDPEITRTGHAYCWSWFIWSVPEVVVDDCSAFAIAEGREPPGKIHFPQPRRA